MGEKSTTSDILGAPESDGKPNSNSSGNKKRYAKKGNKNFKPKDKGIATNNPAYYTKYPELLEGSANLNYADSVGNLIKWKNATVAGSTVVGDQLTCSARAVPGVLGIMTKPTFGYNDSPKSPLNIAANTLYVDLRYNLQGRKNYDAVDVIMYMGAISELYSAINWAARIYGLAFETSQVNKYICDGIAEAINVDISDVRMNLANFRYWLNSFIEKVSCYAIPKGISYFEKKVDEYAYVYIENNDSNIKDQLYVKYPQGFYQFALDNDGAGSLVFRANTTTKLKVADIISICESLLAPVWNDEDFALISGDMIKRYEGNIIGLTNLQAEGSVDIVYDELFLLQLKNSNPIVDLDSGHGGASAPTYSYVGVTGSTLTARAGNVYQNKEGVLLSKNSAPVSLDSSSMVNAVLTQDKIIDQISPKPGLEDNIESTRMMVRLQNLESSTVTGMDWGWLECGAYVVTGLQVIFFEGTGVSRAGTLQKFIMPRGNVQSLNYWASPNNFEKYMCTFFKFFPNLRAIGINTGTPNYVSYMHFLTNLDNFTWVPDETLARLHDCAWLSMLAVPGVAKVKNSLM